MPALYGAGIRVMHVVMFMPAYQNLGSGICGKNQHTMAISVTKNTTMHPTIKPCRFCSGVVNGGALVGLTGARPSRGFPSDEYFIGTILCPISGFSIMHCEKLQPTEQHGHEHDIPSSIAEGILPPAGDFQAWATYWPPMFSGMRFHHVQHSDGTGRRHPRALKSGPFCTVARNHGHAGP